MSPDEYKEFQAWGRHLKKEFGERYSDMHFDLVNNQGYDWTNAIIECDRILRGNK